VDLSFCYEHARAKFPLKPLEQNAGGGFKRPVISILSKMAELQLSSPHIQEFIRLAKLYLNCLFNHTIDTANSYDISSWLSLLGSTHISQPLPPVIVLLSHPHTLFISIRIVSFHVRKGPAPYYYYMTRSVQNTFSKPVPDGSLISCISPIHVHKTKVHFLLSQPIFLARKNIKENECLYISYE
jgi:hypothetical protein